MQKVTDQATKVLIVSDNQMICAGIRMILETQPHMFVIGEVDKARRAVEVTGHERPQVVLIDLDLFGVDVARLIRDLQKAAAQSLPLILSSLRKGDLSRIALSRAAGVVLTVQPPAVLIAAIASLCSGDFKLSASGKDAPPSYAMTNLQ